MAREVQKTALVIRAAAKAKEAKLSNAADRLAEV